jgi:hypothetical protein
MEIAWRWMGARGSVGRLCLVTADRRAKQAWRRSRHRTNNPPALAGSTRSTRLLHDPTPPHPDELTRTTSGFHALGEPIDARNVGAEAPRLLRQ